tara:strand:+ start:525 stop:1109 length:585 start_codon:yes stop_codon:yes gene_type:complete
MPRRRQSNKRTPTREEMSMNVDQLSTQFSQELAEETLAEAQSIFPTDIQSRLKDAVEIKASPDGFELEFDSTFDTVFLPERYGEGSVFRPKGISPNTSEPYGYSADTRQHSRRTKRGGRVQVRAHTKYYRVGYKPVQGKDGDWYTASAENNFGLRMAKLRIRRNFLQDAWDKVYRTLPQHLQKELPKVIQITEV